MGKFAAKALRPERPAANPVTPLTTTTPAVTAGGGQGWSQETRSELVLAVAGFLAENQFYEKAEARTERIGELVRKVIRTDPGMIARLVPFARDVLNLRSAPVILAAEYAKAAKELPVAERERLPVPVRRVVASAMLRADEPGQFMSYWAGRGYGAISGGIQRGIADAVVRLYDEYAGMRWDFPSAGFRFGDVIAMTHPRPTSEAQSALFRWLLDVRHNRAEITIDPRLLPRITARTTMEAVTVSLRRGMVGTPSFGRALESAGMSWEALAGWLQGPMDAAAWEAAVESMGYMALLKNLRNLDRAGVSDAVAAKVAARLADPEQVKRSRQLPFRFWSAYRNVPSDRWAWPLEQAIGHSLSNVPRLNGRTLILVDTSGSMFDGMSARSEVSRLDVAVLFALALASRAEHPDVVSFSAPHLGRVMSYGGFEIRDTPGSVVFPLVRGESVLKSVARWNAPTPGAPRGYSIGGGTQTARALEAHYRGHDRVVLITDEGHQGADPLSASIVPASTPVYVWNVAGYAPVGSRTGTARRVRLGGLSDTAFRIIPAVEAQEGRGWDLLFEDAAPVEED